MCCSSQVVRVALLGLKNLLGDASLDIGPEAVEAGLPKVVQQRLLQVRCAASCSAIKLVSYCRSVDGGNCVLACTQGSCHIALSTLADGTLSGCAAFSSSPISSEYLVRACLSHLWV